MRIKYLKLKQWLLVSLGGLLGITLAGCDGFYGEEEYGCPEGTFHVMGTVTNEEGQPIAGIGIGKEYDGECDNYCDTTDLDGRYELNIHGVPAYPEALRFADIDSAENGLYQDTTVVVSAPSSAFHGGDGDWNEGTADITKDVVMRRVEE